MLLKLIIFAVIATIIYRFLGGRVPFIDRKKTSNEKHEFGQIETTSECANCGTYMTEEDAIIYQRKAYCSKECLEKVK
ncbi:hypothetical protein MNB_SV-12-196 [hydrothermal vent metagenome]|uniref:Prokaryotic metallothionein n=1 Tax=hydrothermal vent metagenome TaxID=652676 RepID=A0A1W1BU88_9ZZZZ